MHRIIICCGSAHFFRGTKEFLKVHRKQILIPNQPEMSNAIGFFRYGVMQDTMETFRQKR
jgi:hypothetical protein